MSPIQIDLSRLAIHTQTNKPWSLIQCIKAYSTAGIKAISVWRDVLEPVGAKAAGQMLRDAGMHVPALVRGGFFAATDLTARQSAIDANRRCIDQAAAIGAEMVVLVVGAVPGVPHSESRKQVTEGIAEILDHAAAARVQLAIEPLHPMYAADRSCINRMAEARSLRAASKPAGRYCRRRLSRLVGPPISNLKSPWQAGKKPCLPFISVIGVFKPAIFLPIAASWAMAAFPSPLFALGSKQPAFVDTTKSKYFQIIIGRWINMNTSPKSRLHICRIHDLQFNLSA